MACERLKDDIMENVDWETTFIKRTAQGYTALGYCHYHHHHELACFLFCHVHGLGLLILVFILLLVQFFCPSLYFPAC